VYDTSFVKIQTAVADIVALDLRGRVHDGPMGKIGHKGDHEVGGGVRIHNHKPITRLLHLAEGTVWGNRLESVWGSRRLTRGRERTCEFPGPHPQVVVLPCLISESEETEKDECAKNGAPSGGFK